MFHKLQAMLLIMLLSATVATVADDKKDQQDTPSLRETAENLKVPYDRYSTRDQLGREVTFYLSREKAKVPLAVFLPGSGCDSLFLKVGGHMAGGLQTPLRQAMAGRAHVLIVERPGVQFLDVSPHPGGAEGCSQTFLREHTLPRWAEAVRSAIAAAHQLPAVDPSSTVVIGHSEGAIVAARVAALDKNITHVAVLSGGGPNQFFDLAVTAREQGWANQLTAAWKSITAEPDSDKLFIGHPYRRWSSFLATSVMEELLKSRARIFAANGTQDEITHIAGFDVLQAEMAAHNRDITALRIEGAGHDLSPPGVAPGKGMDQVFSAIQSWWLGPPNPGH